MNNTQAKLYDYIFLGSGCACLSIILRMIDSKKFSTKKILLIDKDQKNKNDRTWCFWEKENGYFENVVHRKWSKLLFKTEEESISLDIKPYQYKMIRGIDFYKYCFSRISVQDNIDIKYGEIVFDEERINFNGEILERNNAIVFNSIYQHKKKEKNKFYLLQHFKGWIIETPGNSFNTEEGTLMDFSIDQQYGTAFVYMLPLTTRKALLEYTLFTENLLPAEEYDAELRNYIKRYLKINDFSIVEEEFGIIPMTNSTFKAFENGMYNIGTAGGQTKASTGYTFQFIQKQASKIVKDLLLNEMPSKEISFKNKFQFYDSTLLHILSKNKLEGKEIFTRLFQKNKASSVFKFLDNETTIAEDLRIVKSLPRKEFLLAGLKEFFKML